MQLRVATSVLFGLCLSVASLPSNSTKAPVTVDNPDSLFEARLLDQQNTTLRGLVNVWPQSIGVKVHVDLWGVPKEQALQYHIHEHPVPENGDCWETGDHLDPYGRGQNPPCDSTQPASCEVGDLSGKHSPVFTAVHEAWEVEYPEMFLSTDPESPAYFGDRSIVFHGPGGSRLNCGNFVQRV